MQQNDTPEPEKRLSPKQAQVIVLLAKGSTIANAAKHAGVADITVDRWKKQPHFLQELHKAEDTLYDEALTTIKKTMPIAIATLVRNMDGKVSAYVQVQAASKLLDLGIQVHKVEQLEREVEQLKEALDLKEMEDA